MLRLLGAGIRGLVKATPPCAHHQQRQIYETRRGVQVCRSRTPRTHARSWVAWVSSRSCVYRKFKKKLAVAERIREKQKSESGEACVLIQVLWFLSLSCCCFFCVIERLFPLPFLLLSLFFCCWWMGNPATHLAYGRQRRKRLSL